VTERIKLGTSVMVVTVHAPAILAKPDISLDVSVMRRYSELGVDRLLVAARESGSSDVEDIANFVLRVQDEVISRL
jgi:hypothetical protein